MNNHSHLFGLCEVSCDLNPGFDKGLKNEYIGYFAGLFEAKTMRIWLKLNEVFKVKENDELEPLPQLFIRLHQFLMSLKQAGVERFILFAWSFLMPFGLPNDDPWAVPDYEKDKTLYERFLKIQANAMFEIARNFTEICYYEPTNEPDGLGGMFLHKFGYSSHEDKTPYLFDINQIIHVVLDLCYVTNKAVKKASSYSSCILPGFCNFDSAPKFLDGIYNAIESHTLPTFGEKSIKIDDYFSVVNWHPYNLKDSDINQYWIDSQIEIRKVMMKHRDYERKVWYTEIGWSDFKRVDEPFKIAQRYIDLFETVQTRLPFVDSLMFFRLFTLANRVENEGEDNFGLVYNEYDWDHPLFPKPAAVRIYKYIHGQNADLSPLFKYSKEKEFTLFPSTVINPNAEGDSFLFIGNYITYQQASPINKWNQGRGLGSSSISNDYVHILMEKLGQKNAKIKLVNAKAFEKSFYSDDVYNGLLGQVIESTKYVVISLGDSFGECSLKDHNLIPFYSRLIGGFKQKGLKVFVTSAYSKDSSINSLIEEACKQNNITMIDIAPIFLNKNSLLDRRYENNEYKFIPNDLGHMMIAETIYKQMINSIKEDIK